MNKDKLRAKCHQLSKETGLSFNTVQTFYFLESIVEKIADSDENLNFIVKGGFLLSNVIGIKQRSTVDIDFLVRRMNLTEENIKNAFQRILHDDNDSGITHEIQKIEQIRKDDEYGGFRITILCKLENIRQIIPIDIATGDPITPNDIHYKYKSIFGDKIFDICAYNLETILAEKIQTVYQKGIFNSRSKDFYDLYIIKHLKQNSIDFQQLRKACINTFKYRNSDYDKADLIKILHSIKKSNTIRTRWKSYQKTFSYAQDISFDDVINSVLELIDKI